MLNFELLIDNNKAETPLQNLEGSVKILNRPMVSNDDNNAQSLHEDTDVKKVFICCRYTLCIEIN